VRRAGVAIAAASAEARTNLLFMKFLR